MRKYMLKKIQNVDLTPWIHQMAAYYATLLASVPSCCICLYTLYLSSPVFNHFNTGQFHPLPAPFVFALDWVVKDLFTFVDGGGKDNWLSWVFGWQTLCQKHCILVSGATATAVVFYACDCCVLVLQSTTTFKQAALCGSLCENVSHISQYSQRVKWSNLLIFCFCFFLIEELFPHFLPLIFRLCDNDQENTKILTRALIFPYCIQNKINFLVLCFMLYFVQKQIHFNLNIWNCFLALKWM